MANRLWHYHFGVGLVDTPNDFGFNGGRPANQPLLDWLAAELVAQSYHLKPLHRLIVMSAAIEGRRGGTPLPRKSMPTIGCSGARLRSGWKLKPCATRCCKRPACLTSIVAGLAFKR